MRSIGFILFSLLSLPIGYVNGQTVSDSVAVFPDQGHFRYLSIVGGYALNFGEEDDPVNHLIELGISLSDDYLYHHPTNANYHFTTEIKLNDEFIIGPKVGFYKGFWMITYGADLILYTDFESQSLRISPNFGLGGGVGKIYIGFNIPITNKDFEHIEVGKIGIFFSLYKLFNRKVE